MHHYIIPTLRGRFPEKLISCSNEVAKQEAALPRGGSNLISFPISVDGVINDNFEAITIISSTKATNLLADILAEFIWADVLGGLSVIANRNNNYEKNKIKYI